MGRMDPRVYYRFRKFAKTVMKYKDRIECVVIGVDSAKLWASRQDVKMTFDESAGVPTENRMFGVPVVWMKGFQGAQIQYIR